jgi:hypothetical protein
MAAELGLSSSSESIELEVRSIDGSVRHWRLVRLDCLAADDGFSVFVNGTSVFSSGWKF